jgi:hypothetical protein
VKTFKKALLMKYQLPGGKNASLTIFGCFVIGAICGFISVRYIPAMFGG